jgi:hypothetical protein
LKWRQEYSYRLRNQAGFLVGLPFSDKKIIPRNTEQDGTDNSSVGIPPVSSKSKTSEFRSESFLRSYKPWEFRSEPFIGREKPWEFHSKPFLDEKNLGIPFQTIFGRESYNRHPIKLQPSPN